MSDVHLLVTDESLYVGSGAVHRWLLGVGNRMYQNVVHAAPERTGELKMGIGLDFEQGPSLRILSAVVSSSAPHTKYVIGGTAGNGAGYIYTKRGYANQGAITAYIESGGRTAKPGEGMWMQLKDVRGGIFLRVHGQRANNFLRAGYDATARTHRALHPIFPGVVT